MQFAQPVDESLYDGEGSAPHARDGALYVRFYLEPMENPAKTAESGRPIFEDVEFIEKQVPGDKTLTVQRPVTDRDKREFARQYRAWKADATAEQTSGTPLKAWPQVSRAQVEELAFFKVRTVEDLANLSDALLANLGPYRELQKKACDFLAAARGHAPTSALRTALEEEKQKREALERQVQELLAAQGKKRGPKRTEETDDEG